MPRLRFGKRTITVQQNNAPHPTSQRAVTTKAAEYRCPTANRFKHQDRSAPIPRSSFGAATRSVLRWTLPWDSRHPEKYRRGTPPRSSPLGRLPPHREAPRLVPIVPQSAAKSCGPAILAPQEMRSGRTSGTGRQLAVPKFSVFVGRNGGAENPRFFRGFITRDAYFVGVFSRVDLDAQMVMLGAVW